MSRHRSAVRPRYGRIVLALAALSITVFSVLGGVGLVGTTPSAAKDAGLASALDAPSTPTETAEVETTVLVSTVLGPNAPAEAEEEPDPTALPANTGKGRRIVFSEGAQRVWLVGAKGSVRRTYLASGSLVDNLDPGTYAVYSKSRWAIGVDDTGVMEYFVRFAHGEEAAIGFHTIPTKDGTALQTRAQLGTPQSHGCIRQATADAIALWNFAPEGTTVVVI